MELEEMLQASQCTRLGLHVQHVRMDTPVMAICVQRTDNEHYSKNNDMALLLL